MAKPGPRPQPTSKKIVKGNPGRRPLPKNEPKPRISENIPSAPGHLSKVGKKEWRRVTKELHPIGLITKIDITALAAYCSAYATWVECQEKIQKTGLLIKAPSGYPIINPLLSISNKAVIQMKSFLIEFGMTPSSRSRVEGIKAEAEGDPLENFFKRAEKLKVVKGNKED